MGTARALGKGGYEATIEENAAGASADNHAEVMSPPAATGPQIAAMSLLSLLALSAGIIIATLSGHWK